MDLGREEAMLKWPSRFLWRHKVCNW